MGMQRYVDFVPRPARVSHSLFISVPVSPHPLSVGFCFVVLFLHLLLVFMSASQALEHESMESLKIIDTKPIDLYSCFRAFVRKDQLGEDESWYVRFTSHTHTHTHTHTHFLRPPLSHPLLVRISLSGCLSLSSLFCLFPPFYYLFSNVLLFLPPSWSGRYCKRCKTHREAVKSLEIWRLPPILVRSGFDGEKTYGRGAVGEKFLKCLCFESCCIIYYVMVAIEAAM